MCSPATALSGVRRWSPCRAHRHSLSHRGFRQLGIESRSIPLHIPARISTLTRGVWVWGISIAHGQHTGMDGGTNTVATLKFEAQVVKCATGGCDETNKHHHRSTYRNFQSLAKRNFHADEAAALALKFASGAVPRPLDPKAIVLDAQGGADLRVVLTHLASMFSTPETLAASFARKRSAAVRCCHWNCTRHTRTPYRSATAMWPSISRPWTQSTTASQTMQPWQPRC